MNELRRGRRPDRRSASRAGMKAHAGGDLRVRASVSEPVGGDLA
jgi:hypothetical protein